MKVKKVIKMEKLGAVLGVVVSAFIVLVLLTWPTMWLWNNCLVPAVNGVNPIGMWQALGLMLLFNILVKPNPTKTK